MALRKESLAFASVFLDVLDLEPYQVSDLKGSFAWYFLQLCTCYIVGTVRHVCQWNLARTLFSILVIPRCPAVGHHAKFSAHPGQGIWVGRAAFPSEIRCLIPSVYTGLDHAAPTGPIATIDSTLPGLLLETQNPPSAGRTNARSFTALGSNLCYCS